MVAVVGPGIAEDRNADVDLRQLLRPESAQPWFVPCLRTGLFTGQVRVHPPRWEVGDVLQCTGTPDTARFLRPVSQGGQRLSTAAGTTGGPRAWRSGRRSA